MMTQQLGFSILTAPLAAIDRRALSQAWYSALHVAQTGGTHSEVARARVETPGVERAAHPSERLEPPHVMQRDARASSRPGAVKLRVLASPERRAERSALARHIERTFLNPMARTQRATFTIDGTRTRVHVALQTTPAGVRIVAVCPASIQARVSRALDEARYALAARGITLRSDVSEGLSQ